MPLVGLLRHSHADKNMSCKFQQEAMKRETLRGHCRNHNAQDTERSLSDVFQYLKWDCSKIACENLTDEENNPRLDTKNRALCTQSGA